MPITNEQANLTCGIWQPVADNNEFTDDSLNKIYEFLQQANRTCQLSLKTPSVPPICLQMGWARRLTKMNKVVGKRKKNG